MSVLVIGAGPGGLAIAACLKRRQVPFDLVDRRGIVGGGWAHVYAGTTLMSPARYTSLPGFRLRHAREYITAREYTAYLQAYAAHHDLQARRADVTQITPQRGSFAVQFRDEPEPRSYRAVVVATGMYDFPVWPEIPGLTNDSLITLHAKDWRGPAFHQGKRLLVIGGASGAIEIAEECARAGQSVVLSARSGIKISAQRFAGRDAHDFAYLVADTLPRVLLGSFCDRRPTLPGLDLGFTRFRKDPRLYFIGIPCCRSLVSEFLRGIARDAPAMRRRSRYRLRPPYRTRQRLSW